MVGFNGFRNRGERGPVSARTPRIVWHLLGLALAASLPFFALTAYLSYASIEHEAEEAAADIQRSAQVTVNSVERLLVRVRTLLARLGPRERIRALNPQDCDPALAAILSFNPDFNNVFTVAVDGTRICSALPLPPNLPAVNPKSYLAPLIERKRFTLGPTTRGGITGKWTVFAAEPIFRDGELAGLVALGLDLTALTAVMDPRSLPGAGVTAIIDSTGRIVTRYPDPESWIGRDITPSPAARRALEGGSGTLRMAGMDDVDRIWAYAPVAGTDWIVLTGVPAAAILERPRGYAAWLAGLGTAITLGAVLLSLALARRIAAPIEAIARAATHMGEEGAKELVPTGPAEAVALAEELNRRSAQRAAMERNLREERARLEGLVSSAMDAVITLDASHRIMMFNPAAERMFGVAADAVLGKSLEGLMPESYRAGHEANIAQFERDGTTTRQMGALGTVRGIRATGEEFPIEVSISQVQVAGQRYLTAIVRDISDRVKAELEVRMLAANLERRVEERTAQLEAINKELEVFDYSISHDLRGPLGRVLGFAAALRDDCGERLDDAGRGYLARIESTGRDMDQLVTDMLALSTISRGEVNCSAVYVSAMVSRVFEGLQVQQPHRRVEIKVEPGLHAFADAGLLRIVLDNLIGNAWKFTSHRDSALIEVGSADIDGRRRAFFVRDNGAGFDPAAAGNLFVPFRRLHSKAQFEGTGVGLATVQRIVRRHGGTIWAESAPGQGATFYFTLEP